MPLAGHGLRPAALRRRASRPQLKRDPLGSHTVPSPTTNVSPHSMAKYPMTEPIAQRQYMFQEADRLTPIVVRIGKPAPFPDGPQDWYCPYTIEGPDVLREHYAGGVDPLQALLLTLSGLRAHLLHLARRGKLTWLDSEDLGLAFVGPAA